MSWDWRIEKSRQIRGNGSIRNTVVEAFDVVIAHLQKVTIDRPCDRKDGLSFEGVVEASLKLSALLQCVIVALRAISDDGSWERRRVSSATGSALESLKGAVSTLPV